MKNKLFIIAAMLIFGLNVASADGNTPLSSDVMTFSIPSMTSIEVDSSSSVLSATATRSNTNTASVTLSSPLTAVFNVSTLETEGIQVALTATAPVDTNSNAWSDLYADNKYVVFTKSDGSTTLNAANDARSAAGSSVANNPNAIAFPISCTNHDLDRAIYGLDYYVDTDTPYNGAIAYNITGEKEISCTISGDSKTGTFGMNDESGSYTATLKLTQVVLDYSSDPWYRPTY